MLVDYITYCIYGLFTGVLLTIVCLLYGFHVTLSTVQFMDSLLRRPTRRWSRRRERQAMNIKREALEGITRQVRSVPPMQLSAKCTMYNYKRKRKNMVSTATARTSSTTSRSVSTATNNSTGKNSQFISHSYGGGSTERYEEKCSSKGSVTSATRGKANLSVGAGLVGGKVPKVGITDSIHMCEISLDSVRPDIPPPAVKDLKAKQEIGAPEGVSHSPAPITVLSALESESPQEGRIGLPVYCKIVLLEGEIHVYEILSSSRSVLGGVGGGVGSGAGGSGGGGVVVPWSVRGGGFGSVVGSGGAAVVGGLSSGGHHAMSLGGTAEHFLGRIPLSAIKVEHYKPHITRERKTQTFFSYVDRKDDGAGNEGDGGGSGPDFRSTQSNSVGTTVTSTTSISSGSARVGEDSSTELLLFSRWGQPLFINSRFGKVDFRSSSSSSSRSTSSRTHMRINPLMEKGNAVPTPAVYSNNSNNSAHPLRRPPLGFNGIPLCDEVPVGGIRDRENIPSFLGEEQMYPTADFLKIKNTTMGGSSNGNSGDLLSWTAMLLIFSDPLETEMWYSVLKRLDEVESWREYLKNIPIPDTLNTFLWRLLFPSLRHMGLEGMLKRSIREKLVEVTDRKFPRFLTGGIHLDDFVLGASIPWVSEVSAPAMSTHGETAFDLNILYKGEATGFVLYFRFALSYKGIRIPQFILSIKLLELQASLHISIGPPASKKIWVGLHRPPILRIQANQGCASGKGFLHRILTSLPDISGIVCNLLRLYLFSEMILPEMDDFPLPSIEVTPETSSATNSEKRKKGNYFDHKRAAEKSCRVHLDSPELSSELSSSSLSAKKKSKIKKK